LLTREANSEGDKGEEEKEVRREEESRVGEALKKSKATQVKSNNEEATIGEGGIKQRILLKKDRSQSKGGGTWRQEESGVKEICRAAEEGGGLGRKVEKDDVSCADTERERDSGRRQAKGTTSKKKGLKQGKSEINCRGKISTDRAADAPPIGRGKFENLACKINEHSSNSSGFLLRRRRTIRGHNPKKKKLKKALCL